MPDTYVVKAGDTLSKIDQTNGYKSPWRDILPRTGPSAPPAAPPGGTFNPTKGLLRIAERDKRRGSRSDCAACRAK